MTIHDQRITMHKTIITAFLLSTVALPLMSSEDKKVNATPNTIEIKINALYRTNKNNKFFTQKKLNQLKEELTLLNKEASKRINNLITNFAKECELELCKHSTPLRFDSLSFNFVANSQLKLKEIAKKTTQKDN